MVTLPPMFRSRRGLVLVTLATGITAACNETRGLRPADAMAEAGNESDAASPTKPDTPGNPNVMDLPGGIKRVTLTRTQDMGAMGQAWNLEQAKIAEDVADSDFAMFITTIVSFFGTSPSKSAFCTARPDPGGTSFESVEQIPSAAQEACVSWGGAYLGPLTEHSESAFKGQAYFVRDRRGVAVSKLLTIADTVSAEGFVSVTFDVMAL